ncbi:MAG: GTP diphosphokinase [Betaproteobacteria bacterium]|nr:GTP diphosphokinase [Betaproteobacteria bacterium]
MVSVSSPHWVSSPLDVPDIEAWLASIASNYSAAERDTLRRAYAFAQEASGDRRAKGATALVQHALGVAVILADMRMDCDTVAAGLLHATPDWPSHREGVAAQFGTPVARLVEGMARMSLIHEYGERHGYAQATETHDMSQTEGLRKMLLAMVEDIRVVVIKLAERVQTMRALGREDEAKRRLTAKETLSIFAPLANRLGVWQLKWELEDLSLRYLEPDLYRKVAKLLDERRASREQYIARVVETLAGALREAGLAAEVTGRPKHIYSIINKMKRKHLDFSELYDVRAVRVLVDEIKDCYTVLGLVHNLWVPIPGEFDDYISHPKSNDYRSLHTAVIGPDGKAVEVQIRTREMHQHAELGVAAHWRYKEGAPGNAKYDEKIAWLRRLLDWKEDLAEGGDLMEQFRNELFQDQVYVLTPQGRVIDLPKGATPVDFAYHVHTDLGHRCRGAKVDGTIVPLSYALQNGQRIEILTTRLGGPSRDWLNPALGYLKSARARAKVRHWFKYQNFEENVSQGRVQLDRELKRLGLDALNQERLAQKLGFPRLEEFLAALGRGDVGNRQVVSAIQEDVAPRLEGPKAPAVTRPAASRQDAGVLVEGVGNLLTNIAKCCKPAPPDPVVGYVTRGRGVTIHRKDCPNMLRLSDERRARLVAAQWGSRQTAAFAVDIEVLAYDRQGLLRDVSDVFVRERINAIKAETLTKDDRATMRFTLEVGDLEQLSRLLALLQQLPNVISARRRV